MGAISWILIGLLLCASNRGLGRRFGKWIGDGQQGGSLPRPISADAEPGTWPGMPYVVAGTSAFLGGWSLTLFGIGSVDAFGCSNVLNLAAAGVSTIFLPWFVRGLGLLFQLLFNEVLSVASIAPRTSRQSPEWRSRASVDPPRTGSRPESSPGARPRNPPPPPPPPPPVSPPASPPPDPPPGGDVSSTSRPPSEPDPRQETR